MALGTSLLLALLGTFVASQETHRTLEEHPVLDPPRLPGAPNNVPVLGLDPEEVPQYVQDNSTKGEINASPGSAQKPSEKLNMYEWMALMRELGYWENGDEPVQAFWDRLDAWDASRLAEDSSSSS